MNDAQTRKFDHFRDMLGVFTTHTDTIARYPRLSSKVEAFRTTVGLIQMAARITVGPGTTGITADKGEVKHTMATRTVELASAALAYADEENIHALRAIFDVTYSDVYYAPNEEALNVVEMIAEELEKILGALEDYGVTAEDVAELSEMAAQFASLSETQGGVQAESKQAHKDVKVHLAKANYLLTNQIDKLVLSIQRKEPAFASTYFGMRKKAPKSSGGTGGEAPAPDLEQT